MTKPYLYKDSGNVWIGKIPSEWQISNFNYYIDLRHGFQFREYDFTDNGIKIIKITQLDKNGQLNLSKCSFISKDRLQNFTNILISKGDILMALTGGTIGKIIRVGSINEPLLQNYRVGKFESRHVLKMSNKYIFWLMSSEIILEQINFSQRETGQPNIGKEDFSFMSICIPPLSEQKAIATYLDKKIILIDTLVEKIAQKIELLKEQRTAIINQAVTKGLDPKAKMKDSGVEWIGEIPERWKIVELRRIIDPNRKITYGIVQPGKEDKSGRFMIRGQDYSRGWTKSSKIFRVSSKVEEPYKRARVKKDDILFTIVGAGVGNTAIVPEWLEGSNLTQTTARIAIDNEKANSDYIYYYLNSDFTELLLSMYVKGAAQPGLNLGDLSIFIIPLPPKYLQSDISNFIKNKADKIDELILLEQKRIKCLEEYRQALISDVVTGKICVLDEIPTE